MPAFWLTINPSDLQNPLVLMLAGTLLLEDTLPWASAAIRQAAATSNLVAVAQFFHHICKALFDRLLCSNTGELGIFGQMPECLNEMKGFFASDGKIPTVENRSWQNFLNALAELPKMDLA